MDPVFQQPVKILPGLGRLVHIIIIKFHPAILLIALKKLAAGAKAEKRNLFFPLFHHGEMAQILDAGLLVFADQGRDLQLLIRLPACLLAPPDHQARRHISSAVVQRPLNQYKGRLCGGEIVRKRAILHVAVALMDKRRKKHLHQHALSASVAQRKQGALAAKLKALVADTDRIVVIIHINQANCLYFTHPPAPPAP